MKPQEFYKELRNRPQFSNMKSIIKEDLYSFLIGDIYSLTYQDKVKTSPSLVLAYLHIFLSEGAITNTETNEALKKIEPNSKENVWLILLYIEAQLLYTKHRKEPNNDFGEHLVKIDLEMLIDKIKSVWETYKDEYTTKHFTSIIYELTGRPVFEK